MRMRMCVCVCLRKGLRQAMWVRDPAGTSEQVTIFSFTSHFILSESSEIVDLTRMIFPPLLSCPPASSCEHAGTCSNI